MPLTPVEIRHQQLKRSFFGYQRPAVDRLMSEVADSFELVWRERAEFADRIETLEAEVRRHQELEGLLRQTLVSAERAAQEVRERATREAEIIVTEAHAEARSIKREAIGEKQRLMEDVHRLRGLLRTALEMVDGAEAEEPAAPNQGRSPTTQPSLPPPLPEAAPAPPPATGSAEGGSPDTTDPDMRRLAG
jgi:cell division initiation protein